MNYWLKEDRSVVGPTNVTKRYRFIDGNYLDLAYSTLIKTLYGPGVVGSLDYPRVKDGATRAYYYNAIDYDRGPNESEDQCAARVAEAEIRIDAINSLDSFHTRLGSVAGKSKNKKRQKQVDVQLAVDALLHAFNRNISEASLIAGDLDFKPLVDALVSLGITTVVLWERSSASKSLYRAADSAHEITMTMAHGWSTDAFKKAYPLPEITGNEKPSSDREPVIRARRGTANGIPVELHHTQSRAKYFLYFPMTADGYSMLAKHHHLEQLEAFIDYERGPLVW